MAVDCMNDIDFLVGQIRVTFDGDSWHGPSLMKTLEGVDYEQAKARPLSDRHTIWELVGHINSWMDATSWAVENRRIYDAKNIVNWPPMGRTAEEWSQSVERLQPTVNRLIKSFDGWRDDEADEMPEGAKYSYRFLLNGVIQHNVYHAGQIAILKRK